MSKKLFFNKMIRNEITFENHFKVKVGEVKFSQMAHDFTPNTFIFGVTGDYKGKIICINKIKYLCGFESINTKPEELKIFGWFSKPPAVDDAPGIETLTTLSEEFLRTSVRTLAAGNNALAESIIANGRDSMQIMDLRQSC